MGQKGLNDVKKVKRMPGIPKRNYRNGESPTPIFKISIPIKNRA
jgi:hypothetical protein